MRQRHGRNRARAALPSFGVRRVIAADICRWLARAGTQAADEPCESEQRLIDVVLPLDKHAMTQGRLAMLANALADQFLNRYVVGCSRLAHGNSEIGRKVYRKSNRLWLVHFRRLADRLLSVRWS